MRYEDTFVHCPMIGEKISPAACMRNRDVKAEYVEEEYGNKLKENWREICDKCEYSEY